MSGKYFIDTNVLVYSFDSSVLRKQRRALDLIEKALQLHQGVVSWQVVQEFINVALRKFKKPLKVADCRLYLEAVLNPLCEILPSPDIYEQAIQLHEKMQFSFYDSLIITAAQKAKCRILYSEDLQDGQKLGDLRIENPFK